MTEIAPHVYLGGNAEAQNLDNLKQLGVEYVCVLGKYTNHAHPATLFHSKFNVSDHQGYDLSAHFDDIHDYLEDCLDRGSKVLIHGPTGRGVAAAIALMYLIKAEGLTFNKAWYHLKGIAPQINPNGGFVRQLKALESSLAKDNKLNGTVTFPNVPRKKEKNLATFKQSYEYTDNATGVVRAPANKYTFTRAPATVNYDVKRENFTKNATSLAFSK